MITVGTQTPYITFNCELITSQTADEQEKEKIKHDRNFFSPTDEEPPNRYSLFNTPKLKRCWRIFRRAALAYWWFHVITWLDIAEMSALLIWTKEKKNWKMRENSQEPPPPPPSSSLSSCSNEWSEESRRHLWDRIDLQNDPHTWWANV